jgi:hypothetical protein
VSAWGGGGGGGQAIRKDYMEGDLSQTHTIYVLNPRRVVAPGGGESERARKPRFKEGGAEGAGADGAAPRERATIPYWCSTLPPFPQQARRARVRPERAPSLPAPLPGPASFHASRRYDPTDKERGLHDQPSVRPPTCGTTVWAGTERYA